MGEPERTAGGDSPESDLGVHNPHVCCTGAGIRTLEKNVSMRAEAVWARSSYAVVDPWGLRGSQVLSDASKLHAPHEVGRISSCLFIGKPATGEEFNDMPKNATSGANRRASVERFWTAVDSPRREERVSTRVRSIQ